MDDYQIRQKNIKKAKKILDLPNNYDEKQLKIQFRKIAFVSHPDRGGSAGLFDEIRKSFTLLKQDLDARTSETRSHNDLKRGYEKHAGYEPGMEGYTNQTSRTKSFVNNIEPRGIEQTGRKGQEKGHVNIGQRSNQQRTHQQKPVQSHNIQQSGNPNDPYGKNDDQNPAVLSAIQSRFGSEKFDQSKFNDFFNKVKQMDEINDPNVRGYGDQMISSSKTREDTIPLDRSGGQPILSQDEFTVDKLNNAFDRMKPSKENRQIMKYKPPDESMLTSLGHATLGETEVDSFSGANLGGGGLHYMDYMEAHNTSKLIDPRYMRKREEFTNVDQLESYRESIGQLSMQDQRMFNKKEKTDEMNEILREKTAQRNLLIGDKQRSRIDNLLMYGNEEEY
jgi:hypothetical protein